jgi:hypothetical protein
MFVNWSWLFRLAGRAAVEMEVCRSKKLQAENSNWPGDMDYSGLAISELQTAPYETVCRLEKRSRW